MAGGVPRFDTPMLRAGSYLGEISALSFLPIPSHLSSHPLLLAGTGSELLLYNLETGTLLRSFHVFDGVRVHGLSVRFSSDPLIAVFGEKKVKLFILRVDANLLQVNIEFVSQLPRFEHWVLDVKFLNDDGYLALGFSDNSLALWDVDSSTLAGCLKSAERCLLYSMRIWGEGLETLRLASGTIYNEVIVWRPSCHDLQASVKSLDPITECTIHDKATQNGYQQFFPIYLSRLTGHEGSISRISWSSDGSKLVSVSDDRSARIWMPNNNVLNYHGFEDNVRSHASNNIALFGHTARIWDCHISDFLIITAGEDCTCRVWDLDGNLLLMFKEHVGRGIWRCLYDQSSSLLVTAGFDSAIKVRRVCSSAVREPTKEDKLLNDVKNAREIFSIAAPQVTRQQGLMDSKSEYVRCLCFAQENVLYVATNNGILYHVEICNPGAVRWIQLAQVSQESPVICMDLMSMRSCKTSFMEYAIAIGDGMGKATVMKLICGKSTSMVVFSLTWTAEKKRQLLGIYWCKSLGCRHLFTVDPRGVLKLWKINIVLDSDTDENNLKPKVSFVAEFTSYFGARIMCLDASTREQVLVCGDQRGNLTVYPLSEDIMNADSIEIVEKVSIINQFKGAHGISTVTSIMITMLGFNQLEIRTTGGDGCICYFKYDKNYQILEFVGMKQVKELSTIQSVHTSSISVQMGKYAIGFTSADIIMWNLAKETKMLEIPCGGWRRPYSYHLGAVPEYQFCFAFVKDHDIHIHRQWVPVYERQQHTQVLHLQYHGREIHAVCFISFMLQSNPEKNFDSLIATGCEDGTVRITRCTPLSLESWRESKLLGEHIGGSAVRSICFTSKIYSIGAGQTFCSLNDVLDCSKIEPFLLISVGAKQVLTAWILRYQTADLTEQHLDTRVSEAAYCSSNCKHFPISFQWLATHTPSNYASARRRLKKLPETTEHGNVSPVVSDAKPEASIVENIEQNSNSASIDINENDWRYLAVTAFLVKHVEHRFTTCFIVVACSDATLSLRALLLPYRLWFDVALLVPQPSPVLALKHVAVPLCISAYGIISTRVMHIIISGSTDGSISFWDLTEVVENFMQLVLNYQPQFLIDCQKRPRTGRGSQGGRFWRYSINQPSDKKMRDSMSENKITDGSYSRSSEPIAPESSCGQESYLVSDQIGSHHTRSSDSSFSPDSHSMTSFTRRELLPLLVLSSVHQSGVNCLHVSEVKDSNDKLGRVYCVLSGGDDQAVHYLSFKVDGPMANSASRCDKTTDFAKHIENINLSQPSGSVGSSFVERCSYSLMNNDHHVRILQRQSVNSAHSSSVKGIWTNGIWVISTGLDQRIRCWQIGLCGKLIERAHLITSVPEPESLDVISSDRKRYQIVVAGRGIQIIDFFPPCDED